MLERLAGHTHYYFLDGYAGYNQIFNVSEDQKKMAFTCPFDTFAYKRMPLGYSNALATFQRCIVSLFSYCVENTIKIYMDDFSVYDDSFYKCLDKHLFLNDVWKLTLYLIRKNVTL